MPDFGLAVVELIAQKDREAPDFFGRDPWLSLQLALLKVSNFARAAISLKLQSDQSVPQRGIACVHQPVLDQTKQAGNAGLGFLMGMAELGAPVLVFIFAIRGNLT